MTRSLAQVRAQERLSSAGGKARAAIRRSERVHQGRGLFHMGVLNTGVISSRDPGLDEDASVDLVLLAFAVGFHERRPLARAEAAGTAEPVMSGVLRNRLRRLAAGVNREALRATRRLGSWDAVYDLLVAERERVEAEHEARSARVVRERALRPPLPGGPRRA